MGTFLELRRIRDMNRKQNERKIIIDTVSKDTYYKMRTEMWRVPELEYACLCVMESFDDEGYDEESDDVVESAYGYNDNSVQDLIKEAEYVLGTFYEEDHVRNESWKYGSDSDKKWARKEMQSIKRWLKKWKSIAEGKS